VYSYQNNNKLEQYRHEAAINHTLEPIRQQHLRTLQTAIRTMFIEFRALTIGSLEIPGKIQVQKHV
jgi:hypothetical protein